MEKASPSLGRNAQYTKSSRISRLPGYLTIQFVRFYVGKAGDSEEIVAKKILKVVPLKVQRGLVRIVLRSLIGCQISRKTGHVRVLQHRTTAETVAHENKIQGAG